MQTIHYWHREIKHNEIRTQLLNLLNGLFPVLCLFAYLKIRLASQQLTNRVPQTRIVIRDQYTLFAMARPKPQHGCEM